MPSPEAASSSPVGCTQPASPKATAAFEQWLRREGVVLRNCALHCFAARGRGVVATGAIAANDVVVEVPDDAVLLPHTSEIADELGECGLLAGLHAPCATGEYGHDHSHGHGRAKPAAGVPVEDEDDSDDDEDDEDTDPSLQAKALILAVMAEKARGKGSKWHAYLAALPDSFPNMPFSWPAEDWNVLVGTSTHHYSVKSPSVDPPSYVKRLFKELVCPFFDDHPDAIPAEFFDGRRPGGPTRRALLWELYSWATAAVAGYSFELGDFRFQGMVPFWDMLNHVTGRANVRLHHDAEHGALQMIATRAVAAGEELINNYGALSNGQLLRGHGFVEPMCTRPERLDVLSRLATTSLGGFPPGVMASSGAWRLWEVPNQYDAAVVPVALLIDALEAEGLLERSALLYEKLEFLSDYELIPHDNRYKVTASGEPQPELVETARILLMSRKSFRGLRQHVREWRPPLDRPAADLTVRGVSDKLQSLWVGVLSHVVGAARAGLRHPRELYLQLQQAEDGGDAAAVSHARLRAAACVALGEWCALDRCLENLVGPPSLANCQDAQAVISAAEAERRSTAGSVPDSDPSQPDVEGAEWLLRLSRACWASVRGAEKRGAFGGADGGGREAAGQRGGLAHDACGGAGGAGHTQTHSHAGGSCCDVHCGGDGDNLHSVVDAHGERECCGVNSVAERTTPAAPTHSEPDAEPVAAAAESAGGDGGVAGKSRKRKGKKKSRSSNGDAAGRNVNGEGALLANDNGAHKKRKRDGGERNDVL